MHYTKLFNSIIYSTIWREPDHVRLVWITMLALKDRNGEVHASVPGLADAARVALHQCEDALRILCAPDEYSRNTAHEGRRIMPCDGGWLIVNSEYYRGKMNEEERREYKREWMKNKRDTDGRRQMLTDVDSCGPMRTMWTQSESESESESEKEKTPKKESKRKAPCVESKKTTIPDGFELTDKLRAYAEDLGILDVDNEFELFRLKASSNKYKYADWEKAWMAWCRSPYQKKPMVGGVY